MASIYQSDTSIRKRDGTIVMFDFKKIETAITKAFGEKGLVELDAIMKHITDGIMNHKSPIDITIIQDQVEKSLMNLGLFDIAKKYILYRHKKDASRGPASVIDKLDKPSMEPPWGPIGYITYKRTYARTMEGTDRNEEYHDTITRVLKAAQTQLDVGFTNAELKEAYDYMLALKFSVAGRFLWQLGTDTVGKHGLASLQNCAFVAIDEPIKPFTWAFDMLMLGVGVGFSVERKHIRKLPRVSERQVTVSRQDTKDADFIVPDSRQGWVNLLEKVLEAFFITHKSFSYSTILIRSAGSPIKGFGGEASGPEDLCKGISNIQTIFARRRGQHLSSVDCLDIMNIIGSIVVAGNIRRSAALAIGDCDDIEYLYAKRWDFGNIPNWRAMSNNSVACSDVAKLPEVFWDGYNGKGEPYGLLNLDLARQVGRIKDGSRYPDPDVIGFNPCSEQSLANYETCCLAEIFLPNLTSYDEAKRVIVCAYRICKHSLTLPCHHDKTDEIVHRNMRIGLGITGFMQATEEQKAWLSLLYEYIREYDEAYSKSHGWPRSIKLTTVKPSGTLSLLAGVTPGAHPGIYQYFLRRIRISSSNPLVALCKSHGYHVEYQINFDGSEDKSTQVVSFPCCYPKHTRLARDMSAIDQLETIKFLQSEWSDNAVSVTIYYKPNELDAIRQWLETNYTHNIKTCSFLLHSDHGFKQAPYEEISYEEYKRLTEIVRPIVSGTIHTEDDYSSECAHGVCPLK